MIDDDTKAKTIADNNKLIEIAKEDAVQNKEKIDALAKEAVYYKHLKGEKTSTNPMATLFAWSGALRKRAQLDGLSDLESFAERIEKASIDTIEAGIITGDLNCLMDHPDKKVVNTQEFLEAVADRLK